jgi:hypothetical protein
MQEINLKLYKNEGKLVHGLNLPIPDLNNILISDYV